MIRRTVTAMAAISMALSSMAAQAAAPVRPEAATVASKPVRGIALGDRAGAKKPEEASELVGGVALWVILSVVVAATVVAVAVSEASPN